MHVAAAKQSLRNQLTITSASCTLGVTMTIDRVQVEDKAVLRVAGRMDVESASSLEQACDACIADGLTKLVLDLTELIYISSMGLRSVVSVAKKLKDKSGNLRICQAGGLVRQVFEITRVNQVIPMHDSLESALMEG
jgi:anti-anti-sigma factor